MSDETLEAKMNLYMSTMVLFYFGGVLGAAGVGVFKEALMKANLTGWMPVMEVFQNGIAILGMLGVAVSLLAIGMTTFAWLGKN